MFIARNTSRPSAVRRSGSNLDEYQSSRVPLLRTALVPLDVTPINMTLLTEWKTVDVRTLKRLLQLAVAVLSQVAIRLCQILAQKAAGIGATQFHDFLGSADSDNVATCITAFST